MAESSTYRREGRTDRPERVSLDRGPPRAQSQERRSSRPYVRPTAEDDTDVDDSRPGIEARHREPRISQDGPLPRPYPQVYYSEIPRGPSIAHAPGHRSYPERAYLYGRDREPSSPLRPGATYYVPGPNFPGPTPMHRSERESFYRPRPNPSSPGDLSEGGDVRRRRTRRHHHTTDTSHFMDEDGGHYDRPTTLLNHECREAEPTTANQQVTTSSYYDGSGNRAWSRKNQERSGFVTPPERLINPLEPAPQRPSILCFVTVRGEPIFANDTTIYNTKSSDEDFAAFLKQEYKAIIAKARWFPLRLFHLKTIGAVEFQTWALRERKWYLAEVDSLPEKVDRTSMSHFSYQLRHPFRRVRRWTTKVEKLLQAADQVHSRFPNGEKWNFRIHIIEMLDARSIYFSLACIIIPSAAGGLAYGGLTGDFSTGFTIASYVLAAFALLLALVAVTEFLGMESPDSFAASDVYLQGLEMYDRHFDPFRTHRPHTGGPFIPE